MQGKRQQQPVPSPCAALQEPSKGRCCRASISLIDNLGPGSTKGEDSGAIRSEPANWRPLMASGAFEPQKKSIIRLNSGVIRGMSVKL
jgi:hypothetical protein